MKKRPGKGGGFYTSPVSETKPRIVSRFDGLPERASSKRDVQSERSTSALPGENAHHVADDIAASTPVKAPTGDSASHSYLHCCQDLTLTETSLRRAGTIKFCPQALLKHNLALIMRMLGRLPRTTPRSTTQQSTRERSARRWWPSRASSTCASSTTS